MKPPREPLFLARTNYRRRRLMDAAILLPFVATVLILLPAVRGAVISTTGGMFYLFGIWLLLVVTAFVISRRLARGEPRPPDLG